MQTKCKQSLQTDNHYKHPTTQFSQAGCSSWRPTNSIKTLKASTSEETGPDKPAVEHNLRRFIQLWIYIPLDTK